MTQADLDTLARLLRDQADPSYAMDSHRREIESSLIKFWCRHARDLLALARVGLAQQADLEVARGALADIALSSDMTLTLARRKAKRIYDLTAQPLARVGLAQQWQPIETLRNSPANSWVLIRRRYDADSIELLPESEAIKAKEASNPPDYWCPTPPAPPEEPTR